MKAVNGERGTGNGEHLRRAGGSREAAFIRHSGGVSTALRAGGDDGSDSVRKPGLVCFLLSRLPRSLITVPRSPFPGASPGYTLVEFMVAAAVFAVGLAALAPLLVANVRSNDIASVRTRAVALAQQKVENLSTLPFDNWRALPAGIETVDTVFQRRWEPVPAPALAGDQDDLGRMVVTVSWNLPGGGPGTVRLVQARARY